MPKTTRGQNKTIGRVMHEFKHGQLKSGSGGAGGKVKKRQQAVAIALKEAGASEYETNAQNRRNLNRTKRKEAKGETYQQQAEAKSLVGPRGGTRYGRTRSRMKEQRA